MQSNDFLVEIHTEELPPKALSRLAKSFLQEITDRLTKLQIPFEAADFFATPRRLAVKVKKLTAEQPETSVLRRGPAIQAAFDKDGKATPACVGFARSCGITPEQLTTIKNEQGEWVGYQQTVPGKSVTDILPGIVQEALAALPIPKRMRWGSHTVEFVRPAHSVIMLYGEDIIEAEILGLTAGRDTQGHRFHSAGTISITSPADYATQLEEQGFVIADFNHRKAVIWDQVQALIQQAFHGEAQAVVEDELLNEVTGLVEWPVAIMGSFDDSFLAVPAEALISAMQDHQRYFPVKDLQGNLLPYFITISNIAGHDMPRIIAGNKRVLRARLSDAAFFFETDKKQSLVSRVEGLKAVVFQAKLGSLHDKAQRLSQLTQLIATEMQEIATQEAARLGLLAKTDLITTLVGEFPELQGTAGYYYALHDGEPALIAEALKEQYLPRFSGDVLPNSTLGCAIALADRLDTLVGVFGINQVPTGDKDPFGLRRAALGVLRILIEKELNLDLRTLVIYAWKGYEEKLENTNTVNDVFNFIQERLKPWYQEQGISPDVFAAVQALNISCPFDMHKRIQAVQAFKQLPEAEALSVANKRVSNILAKYEEELTATEANPALFETEAERELAVQLDIQNQAISTATEYKQVLSSLANLRKPVDDFFEQVLVMTDDKAQRENRLLLLIKLRTLFLQVADIAFLQTR